MKYFEKPIITSWFEDETSGVNEINVGYKNKICTYFIDNTFRLKKIKDKKSISMDDYNYIVTKGKLTVTREF